MSNQPTEKLIRVPESTWRAVVEAASDVVRYNKGVRDTHLASCVNVDECCDDLEAALELARKVK